MGGFSLGDGQVAFRSLFLKMLTVSGGTELPIADVAKADQLHGRLREDYDLC